mmetsp:Transcript_3599/g.6119  ORF Transcript_3599/g.6119 Transcript_3599/m.6119 type:complete len:92 (+) Transcript_3599:1388-1663(+)
MQEQLALCKEKNVRIHKALIRIFGKFERLLYAQNRVDSYDSTKRDQLLEAQRRLLMKISTPLRGTAAQSSQFGSRYVQQDEGLQMRLNDVF